MQQQKKGWNHECVHVTFSGPELIRFKTKWPELNRVEKQLSLQGNIKGFTRHPSGPFQEHRLQILGGNVLTVLRLGRLISSSHALLLRCANPSGLKLSLEMWEREGEWQQRDWCEAETIDDMCCIQVLQSIRCCSPQPQSSMFSPGSVT